MRIISEGNGSASNLVVVFPSRQIAQYMQRMLTRLIGGASDGTVTLIQALSIVQNAKKLFQVRERPLYANTNRIIP